MTKYHLSAFLLQIIIFTSFVYALHLKQGTASALAPVKEKQGEVDVEALIEVVAEFLSEYADEVDDRLFKFHTEFTPNHKKLWSCANILANDSTLNSGIYNITVPNIANSFQVYCLVDPLGGCAWTVIWRRQDIASDFDRRWKEYKKGFGWPEHNFFIGLERLYAMTFAQLQEIRIVTKHDLEEWDIETYDKFAIGDESTQYEVIVLGAYKNNTNYQRLRKNAKFFTKHLSTSNENKECAKALKMGWWFSDGCKEQFRIRGFYSYLNSPTYVAVRPQNCIVELSDTVWPE
ncbi:angiopoietin-1-like isoform X2 [Eurosta solidaginis]|uniref:angiopoietin-1-like isoform X2 n=1 Tax=Eurosta solidaginis TaxID=178769 RepID=UPI003530A908